MNKKIENPSFGCDPELFLKKNGKVVSAIGLIGGTKHEPKPISENGHAIQEDNVAIEYNIPASYTEQEWIDNNNFVKDYLEVLVSGMGCELEIAASAFLDESELQSDKAKQFGCEPDFNVWLQAMNEPPSSDTNLRVCGGHIAIGWNNPIEEVQEQMIKAMDMTCGLESILMDNDTQRKKMYGKAGCFRFKDFGVEYRTLSNFWIASNETLSWAYNTTLKAIDLVNSGRVDELAAKYGEKVVEAINSNNKDLAQELLVKIKEEQLVELV